MPIKNIDSKTLKKWLENNEAILIDVREPAENSAERIDGSKLIPLGEIKCESLPDFSDKKLVIHCRSGKRSFNACDKLTKQDPSLEIHNLEGGIMSWISDGFEVKKSGNFFLPLERQVQLTIGFMTLSGTILGALINQKFLLIPAFFGFGLCFAAITGWCGLALFLAKMPWNKNDRSSNNFCSIAK